MDGRTGHFQRRPTRKPSLQLRPKPRFVPPPAVDTGSAANGLRKFNRPGPQGGAGLRLGGGALGAKLVKAPLLTKAGFAFALGFFIGDFFINPLLGREPVIDWGAWNNPAPDDAWLNQDPLPPEMTVNVSGEMGADGALVRSNITFGDTREGPNDSCTDAITRQEGFGGDVRITRTGGALRWGQGPAHPDGCGFLSFGLRVLRTMPSNPDNADWEQVRGITTGNWRPPGGITFATFGVVFEPIGEPQGFTPTPIWEPIGPPAPELEPEPEVAPQPRPRPRPLAPPPIPQAPPDPVPLPQPEVDPDPRPIPGPTPAPAPAPGPQRVPRPTPVRVPAPGPGRAPAPDNATPLLNNGTPAPAPTPEIVPTNPRDRFPVPGGPSVTTSGPRATSRNMALELGRLENKLDSLLNTETQWSPNWITLLWAALQALEPLLEWLDQEDGWPGAEYTLTEDCGDLPEGADPVQRSVVVPPAEQIGDYLVNQFAAMAQLQQFHLQLRQPICRRRVEPEGQSVTVSFESDEVGLGGRAPLRKYLRYRCRPGTTLEELANHWRDFTWQAGPVISIHTGAPWGRLQVWAASEAEGRRVIRHAGATSGVDPDSDGEWLTTGTDHARYGQAGTMRVARRQGFLKVTTRDSPNGLPLVSD